MLKMFTTQLTGLFKKVSEKEEFSLEDGARLLAQASAGDGAIYLFGTSEMKAVLFEATEGAEPLRFGKILTKPQVAELTEADRVLIVTRYSTDTEAIELASLLKEKGIPFVAMASVPENSSGDLAELADVHINLWLTKGLLPDEQGDRFGLPFAMAALFAYYGLTFTLKEILDEYEL
ncbi:DUF2529 domain-containing protein [Bacillota bacterium Lsc_1132]